MRQPEAGGDLRLGSLIKRAREGVRWTQPELGEKVGGISGQAVSAWERGVRVPPPEQLVQLHDLLFRGRPSDERDLLAEWLLRYAEASTKGKTNKETVAAAVDEAVRVLRRQSAPKRELTPPFSLSDFPEAFMPLTIICGDRRESPPKTAGDLFVYSVSITDLTFLLTLGIDDRDVTIKTDKLFAVADETFLRRTLGRTNLLVIGSPAVNLAARVINSSSVFRVNYPPGVMSFEHLLRSKVRSPSETGVNLNDFDTLRVFSLMLSFTKGKAVAGGHGFTLSPEEINEFRQTLTTDDEKRFRNLLPDLVRQMMELFPDEGMDPAYRMNQFRKPGILDPADGVIHGEATRSGNDFGFISLAPHPFAEPDSDPPYVSVLVSGIHGPGTAHALRALAEDDFREHPMGGVLEVRLDEQKGWPARVVEAGWQWQTRKYEAGGIVSVLQKAKKNLSESPFAHLGIEQVDEIIDFVKSVSGNVTQRTRSGD